MRKFYWKFVITMVSLTFITACYPVDDQDSNLSPTPHHESQTPRPEATSSLGSDVEPDLSPHRDPQAPGAVGTITLGSGIELAGFQSLQIRAFPNTVGRFDINDPDFDVIEPVEATAYSLDGTTLPHSYQVGGKGVGVSDFEEWRVLAWLSMRDQSDTASFPNSGDIFGTTVFKLSDCSWACMQICYCGVIQDVDVVLDTVVP